MQGWATYDWRGPLKMRLLSRQDGQLQFTEVSASAPYAILSHTWGKKEDEVSYLDVCNQTWRNKSASQKLDFCLDQAERDGYKHVWIDTCCIDKRDFNELTEAINSMYKWYGNAAVCYVYLADVSSEDWKTTLTQSRWFSRGWTLQELIAPSDVRFFSSDCHLLGDKISLQLQISTTTMIDMQKPLKSVPISERYQWSLRRSTSRAEDIAYCMVGLLEIHLTYMYGEGAESARDRLFDEVTIEHGRRVGKEVREAFMLYKPQEQEQRSTIGILQLLESLAYSSMNSRREAIAKPLPQTCKWLLEHPHYRQWLEMEGKAFLWIKGKPGVGKSTLVKFADSSASQANQDSTVQLSFYFNARGASIDRSTLGMYRSLLYQLLQRAMYVQQPVLNQIAASNKDLKNWTVNVLQELLHTAVARLIEPVRCYIDALDECPTEEVQAMVYFLRDLTMSGAKLFVCFASRHYPTVTITHSVQLHIEDQHHADLARYVKVNLDLDGPEGAALKRQVISKANGIFLWAVLAIGMLNKDIREGCLYSPQESLSRLPGQLMELLEQIALQKSDDDERFRRCLHWILYAAVPLNHREYYNLMAVEFSGLPSNVVRLTLAEDLQIERFVSSSSRGLAELTKNAEPQVQFIHESVRDFLIKHDGLRKLHPDVAGPIDYWIHDKLKYICLRILPDPLISFDTEASREELAEGVVYACQQVCMHADLATYSTSQVDFVQELGDTFDSWRPIFLRRSHPDLERCHDKLQLVHVFAINGCARLIDIAHDLGYITVFSGNSPMVMAARHGHYMAVKSLLQCGFDANDVDAWNVKALQHIFTASTPDLTLAKLLLDHGADINRAHSHSACLLTTTLQRHGIRLAQFLLEHGADPNSRQSHNSTPVLACCSDDTLDISRLLLRFGADVKIKDDFGYTALMYACERHELRTIGLLITFGAVSDVPADGEKDALSISCQEGNAAITQMLLKAGADPNTIYSCGKTALMIASELKNRYVIEVLLQSGARADIVDVDGCSALDWYHKSEYQDLEDEPNIDATLRQALDKCT